MAAGLSLRPVIGGILHATWRFGVNDAAMVCEDTFQMLFFSPVSGSSRGREVSHHVQDPQVAVLRGSSVSIRSQTTCAAKPGSYQDRVVFVRTNRSESLEKCGARRNLRP